MSKLRKKSWDEEIAAGSPTAENPASSLPPLFPVGLSPMTPPSFPKRDVTDLPEEEHKELWDL